MTTTAKRLAGLYALGGLLILVSGIPALKNAHSGWKDVLGGIGWFGGCLVVLAAVVYTVVALVRRARRPQTS
jgi:hypothetical protein